ncbi:MAG: hypothetical protein KIS96_11660 [Bauldia sp.]|nr:hypothetical protein [Bauldia sp.]MCW5777493.1 hypothetical protein [Phycisphaeraceae bacterium]
MRQPRIVVHGDRALMSTLAELGRTFGGAALDASMRKGLTIVRNQAKTNLVANRSVHRPVLIKSFRTAKDAGRHRHQPRFRLGFVSGGRSIAHLVEFGTRPHYQPRRGVMHPGARPKPFVRPAFDTQGPRAMDMILKDLRTQIIRKAAALRARNMRR